jgi:hypothetical protein
MASSLRDSMQKKYISFVVSLILRRHLVCLVLRASSGAEDNMVAVVPLYCFFCL